MKIPAEARSEFDRLLVRPLQPIRIHRARLQARIEQLQEALEPASEVIEVIAACLVLVESIERKTSPLYVRLVHAAASYVAPKEEARIEEILAGDWSLRRRVIIGVSQSTKLSIPLG